MDTRVRNDGRCLRKRVYWSEERAQRTVDRARTRHGVYLAYYRCASCGQLHMTKGIQPAQPSKAPPWKLCAESFFGQHSTLPHRAMKTCRVPGMDGVVDHCMVTT